jgi:hypothetical protein
MSDTTYVKSIDGGTAAPVPAPVLSTRYDKDDAELDFASDDGDGQLKDTLVFEQSSTDASVDNLGSWSLTGVPFQYGEGELDLAAAESSEETGDPVTFTATVTAGGSPLLVQHDYDLS